MHFNRSVNFKLESFTDDAFDIAFTLICRDRDYDCPYDKYQVSPELLRSIFPTLRGGVDHPLVIYLKFIGEFPFGKPEIIYQFYRLDVRQAGVDLSEEDISRHVLYVLQSGAPVNQPPPPVGLLTSQRRDLWFEHRQLLLQCNPPTPIKNY